MLEFEGELGIHQSNSEHHRAETGLEEPLVLGVQALEREQLVGLVEQREAELDLLAEQLVE